MFPHTSHMDGRNPGSNGVYVVFGRGMGYFNNEAVDAHGAGSQRSDFKTEDREDYPYANEIAPKGKIIAFLEEFMDLEKTKKIR